MRVEVLAHQVDPRPDSSDVYPLAVQVASVAVATVGRDALFRLWPAVILQGVALGTDCVLETEGGLVTLGHLLPRGRVHQVEVDKGLEGVVVVVAVVVDPVLSVQVGQEGTQPPVVCEALKL